MATKQDLAVYAGDSETIQLTLTGYDNITALDLTANTDIKVLFKRVLGDPDSVAYITKTRLTGGVTVVSAAQGQISVALTAADTVAVSSTLQLQYAAKVYYSGGETTGAIGLLIITPTVIRAT